MHANPHDAGAWSTLGVLLRRSGKLNVAIACHNRALNCAPENANIWTNLGNALTEAGRLADAVAAQEEALRREPDNPRVAFNAIVGLRQAGRFAEALALIDRAGGATADPALRWERALIRLQIGDYVHGFDDYGARRALPTYNGRSATLPAWDGGVLDGRSVFLTSEQGLGDALLMARYLPLVKALGGRVLYEGHADLRRVLSGLPIDEYRGWGGPVDGDVEASQMDLPGLLGTTLASIPPPVRLTVPEEARRKALGILGPREPGILRVGIVWSGRVTFADNARRATGLAPFLRFAEIPGVQLYSLQKGPPEAELAALGPARQLVVPLGPELEDFADTAAMVEQLDLVIMTDSSVAHLAGALGTPVWNLVQYVPYWIYGFTGAWTPWYPTMRLFRQGMDLDWRPVFDAAAGALRAEVRRRTGH
ncbi:tetratricopeptide repeat-containing glycosyltransferase family protein [Azospirillum sp. A1-3]|uniref:glycosyltransferase family 9 protein n=1 Tax=Azospirillum sp. A1-3 TaxID=185874 RepID=UPI002076FBD7|nr:tetratricopeptide repeat-containing glycosyltransferase family protein [Azospirillum sp. A1-3]MCM8738515.1 tetratricopeptide repeat-containing glycosyltransferase family protein [Azospirillum sp. A1-3]